MHLTSVNTAILQTLNERKPLCVSSPLRNNKWILFTFSFQFLVYSFTTRLFMELPVARRNNIESTHRYSMKPIGCEEILKQDQHSNNAISPFRNLAKHCSTQGTGNESTYLLWYYKLLNSVHGTHCLIKSPYILAKWKCGSISILLNYSGSGKFGKSTVPIKILKPFKNQLGFRHPH